jgi:hypothetical protein
VQVFYGEFVDGEQVAEWPADPMQLFRRDFDKLKSLAESSVANVKQQLNGSG